MLVLAAGPAALGSWAKERLVAVQLLCDAGAALSLPNSFAASWPCTGGLPVVQPPPAAPLLRGALVARTFPAALPGCTLTWPWRSSGEVCCSRGDAVPITALARSRALLGELGAGCMACASQAEWRDCSRDMLRQRCSRLASRGAGAEEGGASLWEVGGLREVNEEWLSPPPPAPAPFPPPRTLCAMLGGVVVESPRAKLAAAGTRAGTGLGWAALGA
ncbi:hypothetical protein V8C86DRAFT_2736746 [Haematococcus lacustris]